MSFMGRERGWGREGRAGREIETEIENVREKGGRER